MKYILIALVVLIVIAVMLMTFFAYMAAKYRKLLNSRRIKDIEDSSVYRKKKAHPSKKTDFRSRNQKQEKKQEEEILSGVALYDPYEQQVTTSRGRGEDVQIVGLAKPVGFWSKFVMTQKMGYIMARMQFQHQEKDAKGYWVNQVKAQAASKGKDQSRSR